MPEKLSFPWEKQMPPKCVTCDSNRFISGILLQNDSLKRENYELRAALDKAQAIARNLSRDVRRAFEDGMRGDRRRPVGS